MTPDTLQQWDPMGLTQTMPSPPLLAAPTQIVYPAPVLPAPVPRNSSSDPLGTGRTTVRVTGGTSSPSREGVPLGWWMIAGVAVVGLADTKAGPVVVAFLAAAAIYNIGPLLTRLQQGSAPTGVTGRSGFDPGAGAGRGSNTPPQGGSGGGGSW